MLQINSEKSSVIWVSISEADDDRASFSTWNLKDSRTIVIWKAPAVVAISQCTASRHFYSSQRFTGLLSQVSHRFCSARPAPSVHARHSPISLFLVYKHDYRTKEGGANVPYKSNSISHLFRTLPDMSKLILLLLLLAVFTLSTEAYDYRYHVKCKYHAQQTIKKVCAPQYNNWCHEAMGEI